MLKPIDGRFSRLLILLVGTGFTLTGCVHMPPPASAAQINSLRGALTALHPAVQESEAAQVAELACNYPWRLAAEYRLTRPALWHNFLINIGLKHRGLCYQWAEDLTAALQTLPLATLELHWGVAHAQSWREHNCVIVTARGAPFASGLVLDPWRHSGELVWAPVALDAYPWIEGEASAPPVMPVPPGPARR